VVGSFLPSGAKRAIGTQTERPAQASPAEQGWIHRTFHIVGFGFAAFLAGLLSRKVTAAIAGSAGILILGITIETLQAVVSGAAAEWWDIRDDAYGILILSLAARLPSLRHLIVSD